MPHAKLHDLGIAEPPGAASQLCVHPTPTNI
jgi:hypothetical protein